MNEGKIEKRKGYLNKFSMKKKSEWMKEKIKEKANK